MLSPAVRLTRAHPMRGGLTQLLRVSVVLALLASVLALTSVNTPDAHAQGDLATSVTVTVNITVPQIDDAAGDNIFSGRQFTLGLHNKNDPPQKGCTANGHTGAGGEMNFIADWATYTVDDSGAVTGTHQSVVGQPADSEIDCEYDVVFRDYADYGSYVDATSGSTPLSLEVVRSVNGEGITIIGGTGRLQIDPLPPDEDGPARRSVDLDSPTIAVTYAAPERTWAPKVDITVPDIEEAGANKFADTVFNVTFSRANGPASGCSPDTTVAYTVQDSGAVHIDSAHHVEHSYHRTSTPANDIAGPSLIRFPANSNEECTYTMAVPHTVGAGTDDELTMPGVTPKPNAEGNAEGLVTMAVTWADAAEVLDDSEYENGDDPVVSTHRIRYFEPNGIDTFTPTVTISVPDASENLFWQLDYDGNGVADESGNTTNRFVGRRLAVTFAPTATSPAGCSPEIISFLVVQYDGDVEGQIPTLTAQAARNPSSGNGFFDPAHHYNPVASDTPDGARRVHDTDCEYTVTFPMGDAVLDASAYPDYSGSCSNPRCYLAAGTMTDAVSGSCLLTPNPNGVDNNDCVSGDGTASARPASASPTSTVTGSRLRRTGSATATVTASSSTAMKSYTAPELTFQPDITIDLPDNPSRFANTEFEVMFKQVGSAPGIASLDTSDACSDDSTVTYRVGGDGEVSISGAPVSLIGSPADYPYECVYQVIMPTSVGSGVTELALDHPTRTVTVGSTQVENVVGTVQMRYPSKTFYYSPPDEEPRIPPVIGLTGHDGAVLPNGEPPEGTFAPDITITVLPDYADGPNAYLNTEISFVTIRTYAGSPLGCSPGLDLIFKVANAEYVYGHDYSGSGWEDDDFGEIWHLWEDASGTVFPGDDEDIEAIGEVSYLVGIVPFLIDVPPNQPDGATDECVYELEFPRYPTGLERVRPTGTSTGEPVLIRGSQPTVGATYAERNYLSDNPFSFVPTIDITVPSVTSGPDWVLWPDEGTNTNLFAGRQFAVTFTPIGALAGCTPETVVFMVIRPSGEAVGPMPRLVDHPARNVSTSDSAEPTRQHATENCEYTVTFPMGDSVPNAIVSPGDPDPGGGCLWVPSRADATAEDTNYCYDAEGRPSAKPASASADDPVPGHRLTRDGGMASATATIQEGSATASATYSQRTLPMFRPVVDLRLPNPAASYAGDTFNLQIEFVEPSELELRTGRPPASECSNPTGPFAYTVEADGSITKPTLPMLIDVPVNRVLPCVYWVMFDETEARAAGLTFGGALAQGPVSDPKRDRTSTPSFASIRAADPLCAQQELFDNCAPDSRTFRLQVLGEGPHRPPDPPPTADTFQPMIRINVPTGGTAQTTVDGVTTNHFTGKVFPVRISPVPATGCTSSGTVTYQIQQDGSVRTHWTERVPRQITNIVSGEIVTRIDMRNETFELAPRLIAGTCQYTVAFPFNEDFPASVPAEQRWPGSRLTKTTGGGAIDATSTSSSATYTAAETTFDADVDVRLAVDSRASHSGLTFDVTYTPLTTSQLLAPDGRSLETHGVLPSTDGRCTAETSVTYTVGSSGTVSGDDQELIGFAENSTRRCLYEVTLPKTLAGGALELGLPQTRVVLPGATDVSFAYYAPDAQPLAILPPVPDGKFAPRVSIAVESGAQSDLYLGETFNVVFSRSGGPLTGCSPDTTVTYEIAGFETVYGKTVVGVNDDDANLVATTTIQVAGSLITERTPWLIDTPSGQMGNCEYSVTYPMTDQSGTRLSRLALDHHPTTSAASPSTSARYGAMRPAAPANRFAPEIQFSIAGDSAAHQGLTFEAVFSRTDGPLTGCSPDATVTYAISATGFVYGQAVTVAGSASTDVREVQYSVGGGASVTDRAPWLIDTVSGDARNCEYTVTFDQLVTPAGQDALPRLILREHLDPDSLGAYSTPMKRVHRVTSASPGAAVTYGPVSVSYGEGGLAEGPVAYSPETVVRAPEGMFAPDVSIVLPTGNNGNSYEFAGAQFAVTFSRTSGPASGCSPDVTVTYAAANTVSEKVSANHRAFIYGESVSGTDDVLETAYVLHGVEEPVIDKTPWLVDVPSNQPSGASESCVYDVTFPDNEAAAANLLTRLTHLNLETGMEAVPQVSAASPRARAVYRRTTAAANTRSFTPEVTISVPQVTQTDVNGAAVNRFHGLTFEVTFARASGPASGCSDSVKAYYSISEDGTIDGDSPTLINTPQSQTGNCVYMVTFSEGNLLCAKPGAGEGTELERTDADEDVCEQSTNYGRVVPRLTLNTTSGLDTTTSAASPAATATYEALAQTFTPDITVALPTPTSATEFATRTFTLSFTPTTFTHPAAPMRNCTTNATNAVFTVDSTGTIAATTAAPTLIGYAANHAGECVYVVTITDGGGASDLELSLPKNQLTVRPRYPAKTFTYLREGAALIRDGMFLPEVSLIVIPPVPADSSDAAQNAVAEMFIGEAFRVTFSRSSGPAAGCSPDITVTYKVARGFHQPRFGVEEHEHTLNSYFVYGDTVEGTTEVSEDFHQWHGFAHEWDPENIENLPPIPGHNAQVNGLRVLRNRTPYLIAGPDDNPCVYSVSYPETEEGGSQFALVPRAVIDGVEQTEFSRVTFPDTQLADAIAVCGRLRAADRPETSTSPARPARQCTVNFLDTETSAASPVTGAVYEVNTGPIVTIDSTARATFLPTVAISVPQVTGAQVNLFAAAGTPAGDTNAFVGSAFEVSIRSTAASMDYCNVYVDWTPSLATPNEATLLWNQDNPFTYVVQPDGTVINQTQVSGVDGGDAAQFTLGGQAPFLVADDNCDYTVSFSAAETNDERGRRGQPRLGRTTGVNVTIDADSPTAAATYAAPQTTFRPNISIEISGDAATYAGVSFSVTFDNVPRLASNPANCSADQTITYTVQSNGSVTGSTPALVGYAQNSPLDCAYDVSVASTAGSGSRALTIDGPTRRRIENVALTSSGTSSASFTYRPRNTFEPNVAIQLPAAGPAEAYEGKQLTVTFTPSGGPAAGCSTGVSATYEVEVSGGVKFMVGKTVTGTDDINEYSFTIGGVEVRGDEATRSGTTGTVVETNSSLPENWTEAGFITASTTTLMIGGVEFTRDSSDGETDLDVLERTLLAGATLVIGGATFTEKEPRLIDVPHGESASCVYTVAFPEQENGLTVTHVGARKIDSAASNPDLTVDISAASPVAAARYSAHTFTPTVTITVPDVTRTVSWTYDPDGEGGEPAQTGTETNIFVGKRLAVTFEATSGSPSGCTEKVIAFLVVRYDGSVTGPMPSLISAPVGKTRACEYEVTFPMGDSPIDASIFVQKAPDAPEQEAQHVGGGCLWTPPRPERRAGPAETATAANNYCEDAHGNKVREPASASATNALPGSRLRRDGMATATVSAASATATAAYTAPAFTFDVATEVSVSVPDATYTQFTFDVAITTAEGIAATNCSADTQMTITVGGSGEVTIASTTLNSYAANSLDPCFYDLSFPANIGSGTQTLVPADNYIRRSAWVAGANAGDPPVWRVWTYRTSGSGSPRVRTIEAGAEFRTFEYVPPIAREDLAFPTAPFRECGDDPATAPAQCQKPLPAGSHFVPFVNITAPPEMTVNAAGERVSVYSGLSFEVTFTAATGSPSGCDTVTATYFITDNGTTLTDGGTPRGGVFVPVVDGSGTQLTHTVNGVAHPQWKIVPPRLVDSPSGTPDRCIYDVTFPDTDSHPTHTGLADAQHTAHGSLQLTAGTPRTDDNTKIIGRQVQGSVDGAQWANFGGNPEIATATYSARGLTIGAEVRDRWLIRDTDRVDENGKPIGEFIKWADGARPAAFAGRTIDVMITQADGVPTNPACSDDTPLTLTVGADGTIANVNLDLVRYAPNTLHLCRYAVTVPERVGTSGNVLGIVSLRDNTTGELERSWNNPALRAVTGFTSEVMFYFAPAPRGETTAREAFIPPITIDVPFVDANRDNINDLRFSEIVVTYTLAANQGLGCDVGLASAADGSLFATQTYVVGRSGWRITGHTQDPVTKKMVPMYEHTPGDTGSEVTIQSWPRENSGLRTTNGELLTDAVGGPDLGELQASVSATDDDGMPCSYEVTVTTPTLRGLYGSTFTLDQTAPVTITKDSPTTMFSYSGTSTVLVHVDITVPVYDAFGGDMIARDAQGNPIMNTADERADEFDHRNPLGRHIGQPVRNATFFRDGEFPVRFARSAGPATGCSEMTVNYTVLADGRVVPPGIPPTPPSLIDVPPNQPGGATEACVYTATFPDIVSSPANSDDIWSLTGTGMGTATVALIDTDGDTNADDIWSVSRTYAMGTTEFTPTVNINISPNVFPAGGAGASTFAGAEFEVTFTRSGGPTSGCSQGATSGSAVSVTYTVQADGSIAGTAPRLIDRPSGATASCEYAFTLPASVSSAAGVNPAWTLSLVEGGSASGTVSVGSRAVGLAYTGGVAGTYFRPSLTITVPEYSYVNSDASVAATRTTSGARSASFFEDAVIAVDFTPTAASPAACPSYVGQPYVVLVDGTVWPLNGIAPGLVDVLDGETMACSYTVSFPDTVTSATTADARAHPVAHAQDPATRQIKPERSWTLTGATVAAQVVSSMAPLASRGYEISTTSFRPIVSIQVPPFGDEDGDNVFSGHTFDVTFARSGGPLTGCSADTSAIFTVGDDGVVTGDAPMLIDKPTTAPDAEGCEYEVGYPAAATAPATGPFDWGLDVNSDTAPVVQVEVTRAERAAAGEPIGVQASRFYLWEAVSYAVDWTFSVPQHEGTGANAGRNAFAGDTFTLDLARGADADVGCTATASKVYTVQNNGAVTPQGGSGPVLVDRVAAEVDPASSFISIPNFCYYDVTLTASNSDLMLGRRVANEKMVMASRVATVRYQVPGTFFEPSVTLRVPFVDDNGDSNNDLDDETITVTYTPVAGAHQQCAGGTETYTIDAAESSTSGVGTAALTSSAASLVNRPDGVDEQCRYTVTLTQSALLTTVAPARSAVPTVIADGIPTTITYLATTAFAPMLTVVVPFIDDGSGANTLANETVNVNYTPVAGSHAQCMAGTETYTVGTAESATAGQGVATVGTAASLVNEPAGETTGCRYTVAFTSSSGLSDALPTRIVGALSATEIAAGVAVTLTYRVPTRFTPMVTVTVPFIDADEDSTHDLVGETVMVTFTPVSGAHGHCAGATATYTVAATGTPEDGVSASVTTAVELIDQPAAPGSAPCRYTISLSQSQALSEQARGRRVSPSQIGAGQTATVTYSVRSTRLPAPPRPGVISATVSAVSRGPATGGSGEPSGVGSDIGDAPADGENPFAGFIPAPLRRVPVSVSVTLPSAMLERGDAIEILVSSPGVCGSDLAAFGGVPAGIGLAYGVGAQADATTEVVSAGAYELPAFAERGTERRPCALRVTVLAAPTDCVIAGAQTDSAGRSYLELEWSEDAESLDLVPAFACGEEAGEPADSAPGDEPNGGEPGSPAEPVQASLRSAP